MKDVLFYHLYLSDKTAVWTDIFIEQMDSILKNDLMDQLSEIKITAISQNDGRREVLKNLCKCYPNRFEIEFVDNPYTSDMEMVRGLESSRTITENYTMDKIYKYCLTEDVNVCYIHNKGITSHIRHLEINNLPEVYLKYNYWRKYLNWGVLEQWYRYYDRLSHYDVAGVNYRTHPSKHFSGNFWWSKSSYIKKLPDPTTKSWWKKLKEETSDPWLKSATDRFRDEQWVCIEKNARIYSYHTPDSNPAEKIYHPTRYQQ